MQFLKSGTAEPLPLLQTGLCFEQYHNLRAQLLKAKEHGNIYLIRLFSKCSRDHKSLVRSFFIIYRTSTFLIIFDVKFSQKAVEHVNIIMLFRNDQILRAFPQF